MNQTTHWVEELKAGNKDAFKHLVKEFYSTCLQKAIGYTKDESSAKDLVQEALVQAYLSIHKLEDASKFKAWLMGILRNVCNNHHRRKKAPYLNLPEELFHIPEETLVVNENDAIRKRVREAVEQLSSKNKEVIEAFYFENLSIDEIARHYDLSVSATKVRLHRARKALKYVLAPIPQTTSNSIQGLPSMQLASSVQIDYFNPNWLQKLSSLEGAIPYWEKMVCVAA